MAFQTTDGKYKYDQVFENKTLDIWVQQSYKKYCEINNFNYLPLEKGEFEYDNLAMAIGDIFTNFPSFRSEYSDSKMIIKILADIIGKKWIESNPINTITGLPIKKQKRDVDIAKFIYYS
jgi:hypothetical protein